MRLGIRALAICLTFATVRGAVAIGQPWRSGSLSVSAKSVLADSLVDFAPSIVFQLSRLDDGRVLAGPIPEALAVVKVLDARLSKPRTFMRSGSGPGEANFPWVLLERVDGNRAIAASSDPQRVTLFDAEGRVLREARHIQMADGIGYCGGAFLATGIQAYGNKVVPGVFQLRRDTQPELVYPLKVGDANRPAKGLKQQMDVANGRVMVSRGNSMTLAVSNKSCTDFVDIKVQLPWFKSWERELPIVPGQEPMQNVIKGVRWFDDKHGMMLISRAPAAAVYTGKQPNQRRRPPSTTEPTPDKIFVETVLVLFNVATGAVLEQVVLPRTSWFFLSNRELFHHNFNPYNEWYETFAIDWKKQGG